MASGGRIPLTVYILISSERRMGTKGYYRLMRDFEWHIDGLHMLYLWRSKPGALKSAGSM